MGAEWKLCVFLERSAYFSIGSRVGAVGSRYKNIYGSKGVCDELVCVFHERGAHLASGAEWESFGADTKT